MNDSALNLLASVRTHWKPFANEGAILLDSIIQETAEGEGRLLM
jgi:hypothetical protein